MTKVKICGLKTVDEAVRCVEAGADAIGVNFWAGTPRRVERDVATEIVQEIGDRAQIVAVFVDAPFQEMAETLEATGIRWAQLHGGESPELLASFLPAAYKAIGVGVEDDLASILHEVNRYEGEHLLLDARVRGAMPGGTGHRFDWSIAAEVAKVRQLTLAGGLNPKNVALAIKAVRPYRVDVASGVESEVAKKDLSKVRAFIEAAREVTE